nr:MAG TPA: hypothetical protein [Caudoviricetes sp.]
MLFWGQSNIRIKLSLTERSSFGTTAVMFT